VVHGAKIRASIPSSLEYRDLAIRLVASACKLVTLSSERFHNEAISAFSEALNNVVLHGRLDAGAQIEIEINPCDDHLTIRLLDHGASFDPRTAPEPDLESLPESGLGAFIIRSFMDDIGYSGGTPNILTMTKYVEREERP
jgi:serine/threonine-protein kinase RsbW